MTYLPGGREVALRTNETREIDGQPVIWSDEFNMYISDIQPAEGHEQPTGYVPRGDAGDTVKRVPEKKGRVPLMSKRAKIALEVCALAVPTAVHMGSEFAVIQVSNFFGPDASMGIYDYLSDAGSSVTNIVTGGEK